MLVCCLHCGFEFDGIVYKDELGTFCACPKCTGSFDVDINEEGCVDIDDA